MVSLKSLSQNRHLYLLFFLSIKVKAIEDEIELGQLEEVIEMAKDELTTIDFYYGMILNFMF